MAVQWRTSHAAEAAMGRIRDFLEGDGMTLGKTGLQIVPTITIGNLLNTVPLLGMVFGGMWWLIVYANVASDTQKQVQKLEGSVKEQLTDLRRDTTDNLKIIQSQIANLPTQAARLDAVERRLAEISGSINGLGVKVDAIDGRAREAAETAKRLDQQVNRLDQQVNAPVSIRNTR